MNIINLQKNHNECYQNIVIFPRHFILIILDKGHPSIGLTVWFFPKEEIR